jgi:hypothetical protein
MSNGPTPIYVPTYQQDFLPLAMPIVHLSMAKLALSLTATFAVLTRVFNDGNTAVFGQLRQQIYDARNGKLTSNTDSATSLPQALLNGYSPVPMSHGPTYGRQTDYYRPPERQTLST